MGNMSYCRFENTLEALQDCADNLDDPCSASESVNRKRLIKLCAKIAGWYQDDDGVIDESAIDELPGDEA